MIHVESPSLFLALALALTACSGGPSYTVSGHTLSVHDSQYLSRSGGYFCNGLAAGQVKIQFVDFGPVCSRDPASKTARDPAVEHSELDFVLSLGGVPNFKYMPFTINAGTTCDGGGGPALVTFTHWLANASAADLTLNADTGKVWVTAYDPRGISSIQGNFDVTFGTGASAAHLTSSFGVHNCD